jgi:hypothetical protein
MIIYRIFLGMMLIGYTGLTIQAPDLKGKAIGFVLLIANSLIFWR